MNPNPDPKPGSDLPADHPLAGTRALWHPDLDREGPCWCLFRRSVVLDDTVAGHRLWFSASQRCRIWLDGKLLAEGPPRSDRETWPYVLVLLPDLEPGPHVLATEVVHYGKTGGKGQIGGPAFLLIAAEAELLGAWRTDAPGWRCYHDTSRTAWAGLVRNPGEPKLKGHRAIGQGQAFDTARHPWGWRGTEFDDASWVEAKPIAQAHNNPWGNRSLGCHLVASHLPPLRRDPHSWTRFLDESLQSRSLPVTIPPNSRMRLIADAGCLITAFPELTWREGSGSTLVLTANEAPVDPDDGRKKQRDDLSGSFLPGQQDRICIHGPGDWSPEWIRSFRYLVMDIETGANPLVLENLVAVRSGYPLDHSLKVTIPDGRPWEGLIQVNRDTMAACSHETFFDAPSWEQAQFPGDARIMARHHYLAANDDRLGLKCIADCAASRTPSGLLRSHWPSSFEQVISTYSLQWIGMLHDHWWHWANAGVLRPHLPVARNILHWFLERQRPDGLIGRIDEAPFVDWAFTAGCPEQQPDGGSSIITAMVAESCGMLAALEPQAGYPELAPRWEAAAESLRAGISLCWDADRGLLRDHPEGGYSVHAQVQAVLAGCQLLPDTGELLERALDDPGCRQVDTFYYRAHLAEALRRAGRADRVIRLLDTWFDFLKAGMTTWPERADPQSRSDCHGWGCCVETEIAHSLFGLSSLEPGWRRIRFTPHPSLPRGSELRLKVPSGTLHVQRGDTERDWTVSSPVPVVESSG